MDWKVGFEGNANIASFSVRRHVNVQFELLCYVALVLSIYVQGNDRFRSLDSRAYFLRLIDKPVKHIEVLLRQVALALRIRGQTRDVSLAKLPRGRLS